MSGLIYAVKKGNEKQNALDLIRDSSVMFGASISKCNWSQWVVFFYLETHSAEIWLDTSFLCYRYATKKQENRLLGSISSSGVMYFTCIKSKIVLGHLDSLDAILSVCFYSALRSLFPGAGRPICGPGWASGPLLRGLQLQRHRPVDQRWPGARRRGGPPRSGVYCVIKCLIFKGTTRSLN